VTVLGNQPEAFASSLSDDQSRYLYPYRWRVGASGNSFVSHNVAALHRTPLLLEWVTAAAGM